MCIAEQAQSLQLCTCRPATAGPLDAEQVPVTFPGRLQPSGSRAHHQHLWFASARPTQATGHAVMRRLSLDCKVTGGGSRADSPVSSLDRLTDRAALASGAAREVSLQPVRAEPLAWAELPVTKLSTGLTLQCAPRVCICWPAELAAHVCMHLALFV